MGRKCFIVLWIIISFVIIIIFSSCITVTDFKFTDINNSDGNWYLSIYDINDSGTGIFLYLEHDNNLCVNLSNKNKMENLQYCSGYIIIENYTITFEPVDIWNMIDFSAGKYSEYGFRLRKKIDDKIIKDYNKKTIEARLYFSYEAVIDNENIIFEIDHEFEVTIKRWKTNLVFNFFRAIKKEGF